MILKPCDILFTTSPTAFLSKAIRFFEDDGKVSHMAMITESSKIDEDPLSAMAVEAEFPKTLEHSLHSAYDKNDEQLCVFRPLDLIEEDKVKIIEKIRSYIGRDYGVLKLGLCALDYIAGRNYIFRRFGRLDRFPYCSWEVAWAFDTKRPEYFGKDKRDLEPSDGWDYVTGYITKQFQFIWQRGTLWSE